MTATVNATNSVAHQIVQVVAPRTVFDGWEQYPEKLPQFDLFSGNAVKLRKRLQAESKSLFDDKRTDVHVLDIDCQSRILKQEAMYESDLLSSQPE